MGVEIRHQLWEFWLGTLALAGVWGILCLSLSLLDSRARLSVRVRGWLTFLAGVVQLAACSCPGTPIAWWVGLYLSAVFFVGMGYRVARGRAPEAPSLKTLLPTLVAACLQVLAASLLAEARSAQLMPLVCLWMGTTVAMLGLGQAAPGGVLQLAGFCPLMLWLRLVNIESLGVFMLLVWSWVNPLILWSLRGGGLDCPEPTLLYAYLCLAATAQTLRWALARLGEACGVRE